MAATAKNAKRTASRQARRQQLIDATIKCIARKGMGGTTLSDVAGEAGLSQGIVNLHFESKDKLLNETLRCLADEYKTQFNRALRKSGPAAADKLHALMELDLRPSICERRKVAVWFAFWGEVRWRPAYREICEQSDAYYDKVVQALCIELIADGAYKNLTASRISTILTSMTNGLWLLCLINPETFDRHAAMNAVDEYLYSIFPKHFGPVETP